MFELNEPVDDISSTAPRDLWDLRRMLSRPPTQAQLAACKGLVRPCLEYALFLWDPHTENNIAKLEWIQRIAARLICKRQRRTDSVTDMISFLGQKTLQTRRTKNG